MKPSFFVPSIIGTPRIATTTLLQTGSIPSIKQIETQIEQSWSENFDTKGAKHYRYQIYGQPSKIGAVEVSSVLSYLHIDSTVIQFIVCLASRTLLGNFVWCYFERQFWNNACIQYASKRIFDDRYRRYNSTFCVLELLWLASNITDDGFQQKRDLHLVSQAAEDDFLFNVQRHLGENNFDIEQGARKNKIKAFRSIPRGMLIFTMTIKSGYNGD